MCVALITKLFQVNQGIIYADIENHARLIVSPNEHQTIGSFDGMVCSVASSRFHGILAVGTSSGELYLSWMEEVTVRL